jgi:hypothetical protein
MSIIKFNIISSHYKYNTVTTRSCVIDGLTRPTLVYYTTGMANLKIVAEILVAINVQAQTRRAVTALLGKKVVIFPEICLCDGQLLRAQTVQWELILKRMIMLASFTLRNTRFVESVYCPLLLHVI